MSRTSSRYFARTLLLACTLWATGCLYVIPVAVIGAVAAGQGGGSGGSVILVDEEADLLFTRGPSDQGNTPEGKGRTAVGLQMRITATKATTLDRLRFSVSGTGNDAFLTNVGLFEDANNNALKDTDERRLGTAALFSGDDGTVTFSNLQEPLSAGQSLDIVLVFDIPGNASDDQTHQIRLVGVEDVDAETTLASGEARAVEILGLPVLGGIKSVSATGSLTLRAGPSTPPNRTVFPNAQSVVMSQLELRTSSVEPVQVNQLNLTQSGSGTLATALSRADLYQDVNGDGALDGDDLAISLNVSPQGGVVRFENLAQVIPASGIVQWLVVYTFGGGAPDGASFRSDVVAQSEVLAVGALSSQAIFPTGFPIISPTTITIQRASLNVTAGPFPGGGQASPGQGSVPVLQLQLTSGPAEPLVITTLRVQGSGTGNEQTDIGSARLFVDSNGDGSIAGEGTQLGSVLVYGANDGTLTFSGFQREIPANTTEFWVLAYDVAGSAGAGVNFRAQTSPTADLTVSGKTSALQIAPTGAQITGGQLDVTGSLSLAPGPVMPPAASALANAADVPVLQLRLSAGVGEPIRLTALNVTPAGAADDQADISAVDLYLDADSSGTVNAGDTLLQSSTYPANDTAIGFSNPAGLIPGDIPSGASRDLLVRYQLSGQAFQDETFTARVAPGDVTVIGANSGLTLTPGGSTAQSATLSVRRARFALSIGPQNPGDSDALAGQPNVPTLQLRLAVGPGEDATLNSLTVRADGSADDSADITNATLYLDRGTTAGAVDAGDLQLASSQVFSADDGFVLFNTAAVASFTAGTTHDLLVAYQVSPTSNTPRTFNAYFAGAADATGTGASSALPAQTLGGTVTGGTKTVRRGSLAVAAGASMPAGSPVFPNVQNLSVLQLALTAGFPEGVQVNSVRVVASGSADEAQAVTNLKLVLDQNGDGFAAGTDPVLGTSAIADDGAVIFNLPAIPNMGSLQVPAGQTRNLLLVYDLSGVSVPPGDLRLELQASTDITTTGLISLQPIPPTGSPITGNQIPLQLGTLALSTTAANPAAGDVLRNQQGVGVLQIRCVTGSVESVRVDTVRVTHTGSGVPASALNQARLYFDANANGILDADTQLTTASFTGNVATFTIPGGFSIASVDSSHFLVVYDFNNTANTSDTFRLDLAANADVGAVGNSSNLTIPPSGAPLSGGVKTVRQASLALSNGLNAPTNRSVFRDEEDVAVVQLRLDAGSAEPVEVTSVRVTPTGTGDSTAQISRVRLYLEGDPADGVLNGDQLVGDFANYAGGPLTIAPTTSVSIPAGGNKSLLLVVDHNAPASSAGATFGAQVQANTDVVARGVISSDAVTPTGLPPAVGAEHTIQEASLTLAQGDAPVGDGTIAIVQTGVAVLQAKISAGAAEAVSITSMTLTFVGSGGPQTGLTAVRLFRDNNNNGILDGDPLIATTNYGGGGTATFSLATGALIVPAAGFTHVLVSYDVGGTVNDLDTFSVRIAAASDLSGVGQSSNLQVPSAGTFPLNGATKTARERTLQIDPGVVIPDQNVFINQNTVRALTLRATAGAGEGIRITGITLRGDPTGSGNDTAISVRLYRDQNADGLLDATDVLVGTQAFSADAGAVTYAISPSLDAPPAGSVALLAVYDLPNTAANNDTFRLRFNATSDMAAVGATSGAPATYLGGPFPINGPLLTAIRSSLTISAPTQVPVDEITRNQQAIPMVRLRAAVTGVEAVRLTSLTVRADGAATGDPTQAQVRLFQDANNNGTLEGSDTQLGTTQAGAASVTFTDAAGFLNVPAGGSQDLLVVWDYNGAPTPGQTFAARVNSGDVAAIGSNTGSAITVSGGPFLGGTQTVTDPSVALSAGPQNPTASLEFPGTANIPALQARLTAGTVESVRMTQVSIAAIGSGNDATDFAQVRLFRDDNNNGVLDGDTLLGTAAGYPVDNGTINFPISAGLLDIPAGGFRDVLVVYDLGPGAVVGEAYQAQLIVTNLSGQGLVSAIAATRSGPTVTGGVKRVDLGSLAVSAGPNNPGASTSLRNASNVPQLQLSVVAGPAEAVQITQVVIRGSGTGDDQSDLSSASLYLDDGDGVLSGGDTLLLGGQSYAANGTLTFAGLTQVVPASGTRRLLVTYLYNGTGSVGETYSARLQSPAADLSATGVSSAATLTPTGPLVTGGTNTLVEASLTAAVGANNPGPSNQLRNATQVPMLQVALSAGPAEAVRLTQVVVNASGGGDDVADVTSAALYLDDGDGVVSGSDTLVLSDQVYSADNGTLTFAGLTQVVPAGATRNLLVVYDYDAAAGGGDFTARLQDPSADLSAVGVTTGLAVTPGGALITGGAVTLAEAGLSVSAGVNNPSASTQLRNASPVPVLQVAVAAGAAEGIRITQVVVNGSGSGSEVADVSSAALYLDEGDGVVGAGDTLLLDGQTYSGDDGTLTFAGLTEVIPAGATRRLLVVYSFNAAAAGGTFTATLQDPTVDLSATGETSAQVVTPSGVSVAGGEQTLVEASLSLSAGANNPGATSQLRNASPVSQLQLALAAGSAEAVRVTRVVVSGSGGGSEVADVSSAALYLDEGDGVVGAGDTLLLDGQTYSGDDGTLTFDGLSQVVPAGGSRTLLVVYSYNAAAAGGDFTARLQDPATDVLATGVSSGLTITPTGPLVTGGATTLVEASLSASAGTNNPGATSQLRNASPVSQLQLALTAGAGESVRVTQVVVRASETGDDVADVSSAALYLDSDADGVVGGSDTLLLADQTYSGDDGTLTFSGLTQVVPAGSTRSLLVVYTYAAAAGGGTFAARVQDPATEVLAVGVSSGQTITTSGPVISGGITTLVEASLAASLGANNPAAANVQAGVTDLEVLQFRLTAGAAESVQVSGIRLTPSGLGDDATGITSVSLYRDLNGNGVLDGDPFLVSSTWAGDDTPTDFVLSLSVPASGSRDVLVVVNVAAGANVNDQFTTTLALNADITAQGQVSGLSVTASGAPLAGGTQTIVTTSQIVASQSAALPAGIAVASSESVVLPLRLTETTGLDAVRLETLLLRASGTGGDASDISFVRLYRDTGALGVLDGDVQIGLSAYFADDGLASFAGLSEVVPASGVGNFLLTYTFADGTQASEGETYTAQVQVGGLSLVEVGSGQTITPSGLPQVGPQRTILGPSLAASAGPANPGAVGASPSEVDVELLQIQLTANEAGAATVTNLSLQAGVGSGDDATGIAAATLFEDLDADGLVGPGDRSILRLASPFATDGGVANFGISETIAISSSVVWLVAYELAPGVTGGQTFTASVSALATAPVTNTGLPVAGGTITIGGTLRLSQGGAPQRRILATGSGPEEAVLVSFGADSAEAWTLTALGVEASGSADDASDLGDVEVYLDDGDGVFEAGGDDGAPLATGTFAADDGHLDLTGFSQAIPAGGSVSLWISADIAGGATPGGGFRLLVADGTQVTATGDATGSTRILGGRVAGPALDIAFDTSLFGGSLTLPLAGAFAVSDLASGDLDGDGDQDYVALRSDGQVEVRLGDGTGTTFTLKGTFAGTNLAGPRRVKVADLDRDGWLDVVLLFDTRFTVFTNQGLGDPGNLNAGVEFAEPGATYQDLVLVDYDRDGDLDLVAVDRTAPRVRGRRNDGGGGFATTDALALVNLPRRLSAADFDGDGRLDLALSDDSNQIRLALGSGGFFVLSDADAGNASGGLVAADLDRDGYPDLLAVEGGGFLLPFLSDAPGTAGLTGQAPQASAPGLLQTTPEDLVSADLDGNGILDFVSPHSGTDGLVARVVSASLPFPATGASTYSAGLDPDRVAVADFNGDADPDLVVGSTGVSGQVEVLLGDGETKGGVAALTSAASLGWSDFAAGVASADLDRDGRLDLVSVGSARLGVSLQSSERLFASFVDTSLAGAAGGVAIGDLNRDGAQDLVVTIRGLAQDRVEVYLGQGDGTFSAPFSALTSGDTDPRAVILVDKDRNGVLDALVAEGSTLQVYRGNGTSLSNAQAGDAYTAPSPVQVVLSGDFNRDGLADVAAVCSAGTLEVRLGAAGFGFGGPSSTPLAAAIGTPSGATLADVDRDGVVDLIVVGALGLEILSGDGAGGFTSQVVDSSLGGLSGVAAIDLDKDGDLDLLAPHGTGWALYVSAGGFTFAAPLTQGSSGGAGLRGVVALDLDGDGDQDALFGSEGRELQTALGR